MTFRFQTMSIMPNITSALRCLRLLDLRLSGVGVKGEESITGITEIFGF